MAAGMTWIKYNDVSLYNCTTASFDQSAEYKDGVKLYDRFVVRVIGFIPDDDTNQVVGYRDDSELQSLPSIATCAERQSRVRRLLMEPRKKFEMRVGGGFDAAGDPVGGTLILRAWPPSGDEDHPLVPDSEVDPPDTGQESEPDTLGKALGAADIANYDQPVTAVEKLHDVNFGPKPKVCRITQIASGKTLRIEFEIEVCIVECGSEHYESNKGILSNRWSCVDSVDANAFLVRTFSGTIRSASPLISPQHFRGYAIAPVARGMRLKSMRFDATRDNLNLHYTIVHEEINYAPPENATEFSFTHKESVGRHGITNRGSMSVMLQGDRYANKRRFIAIAAALIEGRLKLNTLIPENPEAKAKAILLNYEVIDEGGSNAVNRVKVTATIERVPTNNVNGHSRIKEMTREIGQPIDNTVFVGLGNPLNPAYDSDESDSVRNNYLGGAIHVTGALYSHLQSNCDAVNKSVWLGGRPDSSRMTANAAEAISTTSAPLTPHVTVRVRETLPDVVDPTLSNDHLEGGVYTHYIMDSRYETNQLIVQSPISDYLSGDPYAQSSDFLRLGPPQTRRVVTIEATRSDTVPRLPTPKPTHTDSATSTTYVLLDVVQMPSAPERYGNGRKQYHAKAKYIYGIDRVPADLPIGTPGYELQQEQAVARTSLEGLFNGEFV